VKDIISFHIAKNRVSQANRDENLLRGKKVGKSKKAIKSIVLPLLSQFRFSWNGTANTDFKVVFRSGSARNFTSSNFNIASESRFTDGQSQRNAFKFLRDISKFNSSYNACNLNGSARDYGI